MTVNKIRRANASLVTERFSSWLVAQKRRTIEPFYSLPLLIKNRTLTLKWLYSARAAQITFALCFIVGMLVMPLARDTILEVIYPPVTKSGFLGIGKRTYSNPKLRSARSSFNTVYWLGSTSAVAWLLWIHISTTVAQAGVIRQKTNKGGPLGEKQADEPVTGFVESTLATASTILSSDPQLAATLSEITPQNPSNSNSENKEQIAGPIGLSSNGRYQIERELGRGGMGIVFLARDTVLDRAVAFKELPPDLMGDPRIIERFRQEARVLARLSHPHIVQIFDLVESGARMWMAMEYVSGGSLDTLLDQKKCLAVPDVKRLGIQMAQALAHAHRQGIIHRDFKPANVLIDQENNAKVGDFGIAKLMQGPKLTQTGAVLGSPSYMSPEQAVGEQADIQSDVYSFGATLYEMLTGRPPFTGDTMSVLTQHLTQQALPPSELNASIPPAFDRLIIATLEKKREERTTDMDMVLQELSCW